jgi:hypothetical protein
MKGYLAMKQRRLDEQGSNGICPGSDDGCPCPFQGAFLVVLARVDAGNIDTQLSSDYIVLLNHDFDHDDPALKLGTVWKCGWTEAVKCTVRCLFCHRITTTRNKETVRWVSLRHDSDDISGPASDSEAEDKLMERYDEEWRIESF